MAIILEKEGQSQLAYEHYSDAIKNNPKEPRIYQNLGINLKRAGRLQEALTYYKKAIELDPVNSVILYNTGILYNIKCEYPAAIVQLEQSIARNKENVYAYLALGDAYERNGEER